MHYRKQGVICEVMRLIQGKPLELYIKMAKEQKMERICYFENRDTAWLIDVDSEQYTKVPNFQALIKQIEAIQ